MELYIRMPKLNIYLPDDLSEAIKDHPNLNVSALCQAALRDAIEESTPKSSGPGLDAHPADVVGSPDLRSVHWFNQPEEVLEMMEAAETMDLGFCAYNQLVVDEYSEDGTVSTYQWVVNVFNDVPQIVENEPIETD